MFDGLKKVLGFGSSNLPETFPDPVKLAQDEKADVFMVEGPEECSVSWEKRKRDALNGKRQRHDYKHGKGAFDKKEEAHRELMENKRREELMSTIAGGVMITPGMGLNDYSESIAAAKREFKSGLGSDEMSRLFKDTAHGPEDSIKMTAEFGTAVFDKEAVYAGLKEMMSPKVKEKSSTGMDKIRGGLASVVTDPSTLVHTAAHTAAHTGGYAGIHPGQVLTAERISGFQKEAQRLLIREFISGVGEEMTTGIANAVVRGEGCEFASEVLKRLMVAASKNGIDIHELLEEVEMTEEEKSKEALALEALAKSITEYWTGPDYELDQDVFALTGANSLTVLRIPTETHKSGYGKKGHIGGEEFTGLKAYLGKRGQIICCFKPVGVEDYSTMEMALGDCFAQLTGFQKHFVEQGFSAQFQAIQNARNEEKQAADLEKFSSKYADFGSF